METSMDTLTVPQEWERPKCPTEGIVPSYSTVDGGRSMKLLVLARVNHYRHNGRFYAYAPYARELDVWADLFREVTIAGTCRDEAPPGDCSAFTRGNITVVPVREARAGGFASRLKQAAQLPQTVVQLMGLMRDADAVHVRCPCDLGLLGAVFAPLFSDRLISKYATQWRAFGGEPWAWRLQRFILSSKWWHGPVTVYGEWPNQPAKVVPFFTSMLTNEQLARARAAACRERRTDILRVLFVGRLSKSKNVDVLLNALALLKSPDRRVECTIVGEGPERTNLEMLAAQLGLSDRVSFAGGVEFDRVLDYYEQSHMLVLASNIEGWPKAIAEGMAFGLVCIGTERGVMPQMLGEGRGYLVPPRDQEALRKALQKITEDTRGSAEMAARAAVWAQQYSLDGLREALRALMARWWGLKQVPGPGFRVPSLASEELISAAGNKTFIRHETRKSEHENRNFKPSR